MPETAGGEATSPELSHVSPAQELKESVVPPGAVWLLGYVCVVTVSQRFIDLLNAPISVLRAVATTHELAVVRETRKWELARMLAQLPRQALEDETGQFLYAGSTALSWLRLVPDGDVVDPEDPASVYPMRGTSLSTERLVDALRAASEGDPFSEEDRPEEITSTPKLVVAREWDGDDGFILTFAIAKRTGHVIHNFQEHDIVEDQFFNVLLRPEAGSLEVRASADRARRFNATWAAQFAASLGCRSLPVAITHGDYRDLHDELAARLDVYRGKTTTGTTVFDTREYTKAENVVDLFGEPEFDRATGDLEPVSMDLLFDVEDFGEVRMHVSIRDGSIYIRTAVPERVIRYVREVLERIKV